MNDADMKQDLDSVLDLIPDGRIRADDYGLLLAALRSAYQLGVLAGMNRAWAKTAETFERVIDGRP